MYVVYTGMEEEGILASLEALNLPCFHVTKVPANILIHYNLDQRYVDRLIRMLEYFKTHMPKIFTMLPHRRNMLSFLYQQKGKLIEASADNEDILKYDPTNIIALSIKVHLCLNKKDTKGAKDTLDKLTELQGEEKEKEVLVAKAEKAFFYSHLTPVYYRTAIELYEEVLGMTGVTTTGEPHRAGCRLDELCDHKHRMLYRLELAFTYNKFMNGKDFSKFEHTSSGFAKNHTFWFDGISKLLDRVIKDAHALGPQEDSSGWQYTEMVIGQAWAELASAYMKCNIRFELDGRKPSLPDGMTVDDCFRRAVEICPDDLHVLERYGMHLRRQATTEADFLLAIETFDKVLSLYPSRHVALHQKALACQGAWYHADDLEKANTCKGYGKKQPRFENKWNGSRQNASASLHNTHLPDVVKRNQGYAGKLPKHKILGYFAQLRASNPRVENPSYPNRYLKNAEKCLAEAVLVTEGTSIRYTVDLGRVYICLQQYSKARLCFENAKKSITFFSSDEGSYLYEQWALLHDEAFHNDKHIDDEEVKNLYRTAVQWSILDGVRPSIAYYKLRDILSSQLKHEHDDSMKYALKQEWDILDKTFDEPDKTKHTFLDLLERNKDNVQLMINLAETLHDQGDIRAAYVYTHILGMCLSSKNQLDALSLKQKTLIFDVALRRADMESTDGESAYILQSLFQLLARGKTPGQIRGATLGSCMASDVVVLSSDSDTSVVHLLQQVLQEYCNLTTFLASTCGSSDMPLTMSTTTAVEEAVMMTKTCIIVTDGLHSDQLLKKLVEALLVGDGTIRACRVSTADNTTDCQSTLLKRLPLVTLRTEDMMAKHEAEMKVQKERAKMFIQDLFQELLLREARYY